MTYQPKNGKAPDDTAAEVAYQQIARLAEDHALIVFAYGGVVTIAIPRVQREEGIRERVLRMGLWELEASK